MPATTASTIITSAFGLLNVFQPGEGVPAPDGQDALSRLNLMMGSFAQQRLTIPVTAREVFDMTAGKGSPSDPYTIGTGANLNTDRPPNQNSVVGAALLLTSSDPDVEVPLPVLTDQAYQAIPVKDLTSAQPTSLYYRPTYATTDFGSVFLWPVPNIATNDLVLYLQKPLTKFGALTTSYYLPDGTEEMLVYNLMRRLAMPYGRTVDEEMRDLAQSTLAIVKRANTVMSDLPNDFAFNRRGAYNIQAGTGG